jgi:hypothetical protein
MGQKFTPDEFGQDKIEKYWKTKFLKLKLAVCGRSGPAPGSVLKSDPAYHSRATSRLAQSPEIDKRLPSVYADIDTKSSIPARARQNMNRDNTKVVNDPSQGFYNSSGPGTLRSGGEIAGSPVYRIRAGRKEPCQT